MVMTDWGGPCNQADNVIAGNDLRMPIGKPDQLRESLQSGKLTRGHLEICAKHILELILKLD